MIRVGVGCDHGGFVLKAEVLAALAEAGAAITDFGTHNSTAVDYPDIARTVAEAVRQSRVDLGILICGTGIGVSIAANKVSGIRAALCAEPYSARMARQHNDANVLCLGARVLGSELAKDIVRSFLAARFEGGRHQGRVLKIEQCCPDPVRGVDP